MGQEDDEIKITNKQRARSSGGKIWAAKNNATSSFLAMMFLIFLCIAAFASMRLLGSSATNIMIKTPAVLYCHGRPSKPIWFLLILFTITVVYACLFNDSYIQPFGHLSQLFPENTFHKEAVGTWEFPLICTTGNTSLKTCPAKSPAAVQVENPSPAAATCPEYFRWIQEDLAPWRETGISREMVEMATQRKPHFRLTIVNRTVYVETYRRSFQTRDVFTQWGILQLLNRYPGEIPDLDMVFTCEDRPQVAKECYPTKDGLAAPPPLFGYDGDDVGGSLDIVFPDWSFWGWPEIQIKPWVSLSKELKEGNERSRWVDRDANAYWKGNTRMSQTRAELLKCNPSQNQDWNARIYYQVWNREIKQGFKNSNLADQCNHRYKIYVEGVGWSVSQKYILACDSPTLLVKPRYYDFFTRSLVPLKHYWPIRVEELCKSIKYAVHWGNAHQQEAETMGKAASSLISEELQMKYVYDYMYHLLTAYAKLLRYKPSIPPNAVQVCPESVACPAEGLMKQYLMDSAVNVSSDAPPCAMPPPYDPPTFRSFLENKQDSIKRVEAWEKHYWDAQNTSSLVKRQP